MVRGVSLLDPPIKSDPQALARVRGWARELWRLGEEDSVVVSELRCSEPGCPPLETVVLIAAEGRPTFQHKLHLGASDIRREDLQALYAKESST
jgi:hypothetical protein